MKVSDIEFRFDGVINIALQNGEIIDRCMLKATDIYETIYLDVEKIVPVNKDLITVIVHPSTIDELEKELFGIWATHQSKDKSEKKIGEAYKRLAYDIQSIRNRIERRTAEQGKEEA